MKLEYFLDKSENLLWQGRPAQGILFREKDKWLVPLGILWIIAATYWTAQSISAYAPQSEMLAGWISAIFNLKLLAILIGVICIALGLYLAIGRFFIDAKIRSKTIYAITNTRAIIVSGLNETKFRTLPLDQNPPLHASGEAGHSIIFGSDYSTSDFASRYLKTWLGPAHPFIFEGIKNGSSVFELIRQTRATV